MKNVKLQSSYENVYSFILSFSSTYLDLGQTREVLLIWSAPLVMLWMSQASVCSSISCSTFFSSSRDTKDHPLVVATFPFNGPRRDPDCNNALLKVVLVEQGWATHPNPRKVSAGNVGDHNTTQEIRCWLIVFEGTYCHSPEKTSQQQLRSQRWGNLT